MLLVVTLSHLLDMCQQIRKERKKKREREKKKTERLAKDKVSLVVNSCFSKHTNYDFSLIALLIKHKNSYLEKSKKHSCSCERSK